MKLHFLVDESFRPGIARLLPLLGVEEGEGIEVRAVEGERVGVTLEAGEAVIYYRRRHEFFRELGLLAERMEEVSFSLFEDSFFEDLSVMVDTSRCGVPTVASLCELLDRIALMGYGTLLLYTEDTLTLEKYPYFGYLRGRYSVEELRRLDDSAAEYGIEVVPCLECYGHMEKYLAWREARPIRDTASVMLAREEATFAFVEELIRTVSSCFRSRRIHIGMDEAWDMGRGAFLDKHGYVPPFEIFNEYMDRLIAITNKYGLTPMMWSDMYFRVANKKNAGYYDEDIEIPKEVAHRIPAGVELVFWHYGEKPCCDDYMLKKHTALGHKTIYAGGTWGWIGHFPENHYTRETVRFSLDACRSNGVREAMLTVWTNDNAECDLFANLYALSYFAELCYDREASEEKLCTRFAATTGGDAVAFLRMSNYHNDFDTREFPKYSHRFLGKYLFWQDVLEGLFDTHLENAPISGHYAASAVEQREAFLSRPNDPWRHLYAFAAKTFDYLAVKTLIAERLHPAYRAGDRAVLEEIRTTLLPLLVEKTRVLHDAHRELWLSDRKDVGLCNLDIRYAGVIARCETAMLLLSRYLSGEIHRIDGLEEVRLHKDIGGFGHYSQIATPNLKT